MSKQENFSAKKIFTGDEWLSDKAIIVEDGIIVDIVSASTVHSSTSHQTLVPSFIDLQIYGANGKLLAIHPNADSLFTLYDYCNKGGALHFLPTVATNT